jgi:hypothetical protein
MTNVECEQAIFEAAGYWSATAQDRIGDDAAIGTAGIWVGLSAGCDVSEDVAETFLGCSKKLLSAARERYWQMDQDHDRHRQWWRVSDLPDEPLLHRGARGALVRAGYWRVKDLQRAGETEIAQVSSIGPKALEQLRPVFEGAT